MKLIASKKADQNDAAIDPWTVVHFAAGLALGLMDVKLKQALAASISYEMAEQVFQRFEWGQELFETSGPESLSNSLVDSAIYVAGHRLGRMWNETKGR